jgi:hypothetical protein
MTKKSAFTAQITHLTSSVKWPSNASSISIPCFLNNTLGILFQTTCNQSHISLFSHLSLSLKHDC